MSTLKAINLQHPTASTANITLSNTGGIALNGSVSGGGMDLITPTSVAGTGVTFSGGAINFSSATSVSVNGIFSSSYENYELRINVTNSSTTGAFLNVRMRTGGSDESGANYKTQRFFQVGATLGGGVDPSTNTAMSVGYFSNTVPTSPAIRASIFSPFAAARTSFISDVVFYGSDSALYQFRLAAQLFNTTSYDSISFIPESGNITGTLRIYGLRNS